MTHDLTPITLFDVDDEWDETPNQTRLLLRRRDLVRFQRRILVVDPEPAFRRKVARALDDLGHNTIEVTSYAEAISRLDEQNIDVVYTDLSLPLRIGERLFQTVRNGPGHFLPFLVSGRGGHPLEIAPGIHLTDGLVLKKPFSAVRLVEHAMPLLHRLDLIDHLGKCHTLSMSFREFELWDVLLGLEYFRRTGTLEIYTENTEPPMSLWFFRGQPVKATYRSLSGPDALVELTLWAEGSFRFDEGSVITRASNAHDPAWKDALDTLCLVEGGRVNPFPHRREGWNGSFPNPLQPSDITLSHFRSSPAEPIVVHDDVTVELVDIIPRRPFLDDLLFEEPFLEVTPPPLFVDESDLEVLIHTGHSDDDQAQ